MATVNLQGTNFTFALLQENGKAQTRIAVENEHIRYVDEGERLSFEEVEELLLAMSRLLAGGYEREFSLSFERAGLAVDLYAHTEDGKPVSRTLRREKDCIAAFRLLLRSKDGSRFLGGVYTLLLHRDDILQFVEKLQAEYDKIAVQRVHGGGKYTFVGVSPLGYKGCNYLYFNPYAEVKTGDYVWVRMGRHNTEQIVYVDSVRKYDDENVPYNPQTVKRVLRIATKEEIREIL